MNGSTIKELRTRAGLTQKQLAEKLGYMTNGQPNRSHIARIEGNHQQVTERLFFAVQWVCDRHLQDKPLHDPSLLGTVAHREQASVTEECHAVLMERAQHTEITVSTPEGLDKPYTVTLE